MSFDQTHVFTNMNGGRHDFELRSVVCHTGTTTRSGHYYTFSKNEEGQWFEMNDATVTRVNFPTVTSAGRLVYILVFSKMHL